ncbi:MAG: hypothetical protein AB1772_05195 [Candidatus Zixiibacteriota bacterium]
MKAASFLTIGCLALIAASVSAQTSITIHSITNVSHDSILAGGLTHALTLRYNAAGAPPGRSYLTANGFKIYSPDGADWVSVQGTAMGAFTGLGWHQVFVNHFNKIGGGAGYGFPQPTGGGNTTGQDTVVVVLAGVNSAPGGGLPAGFNNLTLTIEFSSDPDDNGRHICIDTCQAAPGAAWEWANPDGLIEPTWGGVRCFVVNCCSGQVGDANGIGGDEPTIGDITTLIGFLFLGEPEPPCIAECDVNLSGTLLDPPLDWDDVSIGDITVLIDYLFGELDVLPSCP